MSRQTKIKAVIISLEVLIVFGLYYLQGLRYEQIIHMQDKSYRDVGLMIGIGNDLNWTLVLPVLFLVANFFLYKKLIKAKRWITEPFIVFVLTLAFALTIFLTRMKRQIEEQKRTTTNISAPATKQCVGII